MRPRLDLALAALGAAWIAWASSALPRWTVDDAFIVLRYADNFVSHGVLAFNANGPAADRVEGFTSPFAMLVAIVVRVFGGDPIAGTKLVTFAAALSTPFLVARLARELRARPIAGGVAALVFAVMPENAVHARSGLETELFVAATLALLVAFARVLRAGPTRGRAFAALALLTALVRPEGIPIVGILAIVALVVRRRRIDERRTLVRALLVFVVVPLAALTIFRLAYFHALLPNTFYAKRASFNDAHARALFSLVDRTLLDLAVVAGAATVLSKLVGRAPRALGPRRAIVLGACAVALAVQLAGYARAEPIMDYGRRFAWHGGALLAPFVIVAIERVVSALVRLAPSGAALAGALLALAGSDGMLRGVALFADDTRRMERETNSLATLQEPTIAWIASNTTKDAVVAVYPDAGLLPWTTKRTTIDFGKLNDRVLARAADDAAVTRYFFERAPDVVVLARLSSGKLYDSGAEAIVADPRFAKEYELAQVFPQSSEDHGDRYEIHRRRR